MPQPAAPATRPDPDLILLQAVRHRQAGLCLQLVQQRLHRGGPAALAAIRRRLQTSELDDGAQAWFNGLLALEGPASLARHALEPQEAAAAAAAPAAPVGDSSGGADGPPNGAVTGLAAAPPPVPAVPEPGAMAVTAATATAASANLATAVVETGRAATGLAAAREAAAAPHRQHSPRLEAAGSGTAAIEPAAAELAGQAAAHAAPAAGQGGASSAPAAVAPGAWVAITESAQGGEPAAHDAISAGAAAAISPESPIPAPEWDSNPLTTELLANRAEAAVDEAFAALAASFPGTIPAAPPPPLTPVAPAGASPATSLRRPPAVVPQVGWSDWPVAARSSPPQGPARPLAPPTGPEPLAVPATVAGLPVAGTPDAGTPVAGTAVAGPDGAGTAVAASAAAAAPFSGQEQDLAQRQALGQSQDLAQAPGFAQPASLAPAAASDDGIPLRLSTQAEPTDPLPAQASVASLDGAASRWDELPPLFRAEPAGEAALVATAELPLAVPGRLEQGRAAISRSLERSRVVAGELRQRWRGFRRERLQGLRQLMRDCVDETLSLLRTPEPSEDATDFELLGQNAATAAPSALPLAGDAAGSGGSAAARTTAAPASLASASSPLWPGTDGLQPPAAAQSEAPVPQQGALRAPASTDSPAPATPPATPLATRATASVPPRFSAAEAMAPAPLFGAQARAASAPAERPSPVSRMRRQLTGRRREADSNRPAPTPAALADLRAWLPDSRDLPRAS